jgi:hypothetical protein
MQFEDYIKKIREAADETGAPQNWAAFQVTLGKEGPLYRFALPFAKWGERDQWGSPRGMLVQAFGEQEGMQIFNQGTGAVISTTVRVWELVTEGSGEVPTTVELAPHYDVMIRHVKPEMIAEYLGLLRRFKSAYDAQDKNPQVTRWVLRFGERSGTTFRRAQPLENFAQYDTFNARAVIADHFGADAQMIFDRLNRVVLKTERFISTHRPDLSRATTATTND